MDDAASSVRFSNGYYQRGRERGWGGEEEGLKGSLARTIGVGEVGRRKAVTEEISLALSAVIVSPSLHFGSLGLCSLF